METITLSRKQQRRADVVIRVVAGSLSVIEAATLLSCSTKTIRRLVSRYRAEGLLAVIHKNTGRAPVHKTTASMVEQLRVLAGEHGRYKDFNVPHMCQMLKEHEHLLIGRSTLERLLKAEGLRKRVRKGAPAIYRRRERRRQEGELLQIDGSHHDWLEGRAKKMCLLGGIDDASSKIVGLLFRPTEDQAGYLLLMRKIATDPRYGLPMAFYHDKHTILLSPKEATIEDELAGTEPMSQIQQVLRRLGVEGIPAHSPQAKGRIERLWQTLQDRLIKEMRLAGVSTLEQANAFLPCFIEGWNAHFSHESADPAPAWLPMTHDFNLAYPF